jgi:hypothetical protein
MVERPHLHDLESLRGRRATGRYTHGWRFCLPPRLILALAAVLSLVGGSSGVRAQAVAVSQSGSEQPETMHRVLVGPVPLNASGSPVSAFFDRMNAGISAAGVHDSATGWYTIATPFLSFNLSPHYSADASVSIYPSRYVRSETARKDAALAFHAGEVGDTLLEAHALFAPGAFQSLSTVSLTAPTGNRPDGLGTGRVTFSLNEQVERYVGHAGLFASVGGGDSSGLQNALVTEDDVALGPLGLFQAGTIVWLTRGISLQSLAYEQLPIGDQKTYRTIFRPGTPPQTVVIGHRVNEDNGLNTTVYIPLTSHLLFTGFYNRSLRLHLDTASTGFTWVWKGTPIRRRDSLADRALREAEADSTMQR